MNKVATANPNKRPNSKRGEKVKHEEGWRIVCCEFNETERQKRTRLQVRVLNKTKNGRRQMVHEQLCANQKSVMCEPENRLSKMRYVKKWMWLKWIMK